MAFKAKTRDEATAYFNGWLAAEMDDKGVGNGKVARPRRPIEQHRSTFGFRLGRAFDAGYAEYNVYAKAV